MKLTPHHVGLAVGLLIGFWHLCWSVFVFLGWAQPLIDFILGLHMFVGSSMQVGMFDAVTALELIVVTAFIGYLFGFVFALIWNKLHRV